MTRQSRIFAGIISLIGLATGLALGQGRVVPDSATNAFVIPAWEFDRGNVKTFQQEYADAGPMVAFGGHSPVVVEYDVDVPLTTEYTLNILYAALVPRPVDLFLDGKNLGPCCRNATGSWNTSGAKSEQSVRMVMPQGKHTIKLQRAAAFPHVVSLRFEAAAPFPQGWVLNRPNARKLGSLPALSPTEPRAPDADIVSLRLAVQDLVGTFGSRYPHGADYLKRLVVLDAQWKAIRTNQGNGLSLNSLKSDLAALQREALLANPLLDFDRLLILKREFPQPKAARHAMGSALGVGSLNAHTSDDTPRQGRWNDELTVLSDLRGQTKFASIYRPGDTETILDPVLHFDGDRILFAKRGTKEKNWRLWEASTVPKPRIGTMNRTELPSPALRAPSPIGWERDGVRADGSWEVRADGSSLRQVSPDDGEDVGHFDPCYLPDGRIIFASTAVYQGLPCEFGAQAMVCLYLLDPKTQNVRQLTFEQDSDWCPTMLPNGRVLYQRWEYADQSHANSRMLFHMNPDGTDQREFRGSGSWFPPSFFYAKPVPGHPHQVIGVAGGHHGTPRSGRLLILDPSQGRHDAEGIVQEIPGCGRSVEPIVRDRLADGVWPQFLMPWPLSPKYHLVAAKLQPDALWGIYLVDVFDNLTLIKEIEGAALLWPIPLRKVERPPVIPDRVNLAASQATLFITDIYAGPGLKGVPRGTVRKLRVLEYYFSRRGFGGLYGTLGLDGPWDVKRILGTVPVEEDGSAFFAIPANSPLSLQPLDEKGQALQLMRSWLVGMPGEAASCSGCHEPQNEVTRNKPSLAARRKPSAIEPWHGPARGFSFVREVQPVLDKYCVSCHGGGATNQPVLAGGEMLKDWSTQLAGHWAGGGKFTKSYFELQRFVRRPGIEGDRRMFTPMEFHFSATELGQVLQKGHHGVALDTEAWERLATWADFNAPFYGTWGEIPQFCKEPAGAARLAKVSSRAAELRRQYVPMGPQPDYEAIPPTPAYDLTPVPPKQPEVSNSKPAETGTTNWAGNDPPHPPGGHPLPLGGGEGRGEGARFNSSLASLPGAQVRISETGTTNWSFNATAAAARQKAAAPAGQTTQTLDLGDGVTLELVRIPGGEFVMGSDDGALDESPRAKVVVKPFWMARFETANRQFKQFMPEHESRTEDRHGYQFGRLGYDEEQPDQPAVRVSWEEATAFCRWLSRKTGLSVELPTEAQWEWACRAGTTTPFWFGGVETDFSRFANFGDKMLSQFAADTALDHYTAARPMINPSRYDDWIPRDDRFNDGGFVTEPVGKYQPNPWGLHDMHGNAWEWTRSVYRPYPYREEDGRNGPAASGGERVVRGGSWYDRPKRCTSTYRLAYREYQKVFNVGFRVVCEGPARATANRAAADQDRLDSETAPHDS